MSTNAIFVSAQNGSDKLGITETRARIRAALCDEVPVYGRTVKGQARKTAFGFTPIDLEEIADLITDVVIKARGAC